MAIKVCLLSVWLMSCLPATADTIRWAQSHFPPWMILEGQQVGQGAWNIMFRRIAAKLPQYSHSPIEMTHLRFLLETQVQRLTCKTDFFKTPALESKLYYSIPSFIQLANHIVMRKETAEKLGNPSIISLTSILSQTELRGAIIGGRSYGVVLDQILKDHKKQPNLISRPMKVKNTFRMLIRNRIDYILEFPAIQRFFEGELKLARGDLVNIEIYEAQPYNLTYVTCAKTEHGKAVIQHINKVLKTLILSDKYRDALLSWYDEKDRQRLANYYDKLLIPITLTNLGKLPPYKPAPHNTQNQK